MTRPPAGQDAEAAIEQTLARWIGLDVSTITRVLNRSAGGRSARRMPRSTSGTSPPR
jgi:hypothetical protein